VNQGGQAIHDATLCLDCSIAENGSDSMQKCVLVPVLSNGKLNYDASIIAKVQVLQNMFSAKIPKNDKVRQ
jgi:hypothetical protein